jgi:hypothetical protein
MKNDRFALAGLACVARVVAGAAVACAGAAPAPPVVERPPPPPAAPAPELVAEPVVEPPRDAGVVLAAADAAPVEAASPSACNDQQPQDFLVRSHFLGVPGGNQRAIQYRSDTYGYFPGFSRPPAGSKAPIASVVTTTFMGLAVRMHRKVVPALRCVEDEIRASCAGHPYTARALAGVRLKNTYRGGEITNHIYGIAIDVDPDLNTCCGCVKPWSSSPRCSRPARTEYDRMAMPECWVHAFERFGFYWLGHDVLRDTMHYEFLGDPARILKNAPAPDAGS